MVETESYGGEERRARDRARGIILRRRRKEQLPEGQPERRRSAPVPNGVDIASALEMHLDEHTGRRAMLNLLESWLTEAKNAAEPDEAYSQSVEYAIEVVKTTPDVLTAIAVLQRAPEES